MNAQFEVGQKVVYSPSSGKQFRATIEEVEAERIVIVYAADEPIAQVMDKAVIHAFKFDKLTVVG